MLAWHFTSDTLRDGSPVPAPGVTLRFDGTPVPCERGLHASERLIDALQYSPGYTLHRVEVGGVVIPHGEPTDKVAATERTILWTVPEDAVKAILCRWARWCALRVIHLWNAPEVVREFLETGDESLRAAAWAAARDAAWAAARDADWDAARDADGDAARAAAWAAARDAARDAARAAAWDAAWAAAWAADWDAARDAQNTELVRLVEEWRADAKKEAP